MGLVFVFLVRSSLRVVTSPELAHSKGHTDSACEFKSDGITPKWP